MIWENPKLKMFISTTLAFLLIFNVLFFANWQKAHAAAVTNLALNKPVTVSGTFMTYVGSNAVDGDKGTFWSQSNTTTGGYLTVDLGTQTTFNAWEINDGWFIKDFELQTSSDGVSFSPINDPNASDTILDSDSNSYYNSGVKTLSSPVTARYVKIVIKSNYSTYFRIYEFNLYNISAPNAATPSITTQPVDQSVNVGGVASLSVAASGGVSLSYQWYSNTTNSTVGGTAIIGATSTTYAPLTSASGTIYYYCVVTNTDSSATGQTTATASSSVATVTVNALVDAATPTIGTQPADQTVNVGGAASLSVAASGGVSLSYQWYSNTTNSTVGGTAISGATSTTYAPSTSASGTMYYYCVVTNTDSSATGQTTATASSSAAKVTVNALVDAATPSIGTQPADQTVNVGGSAALSVAATVSDSGTPSYQWYSSATNSNIGGTLMIGGTSATFAPPTGTAGTTYYYVVVTNTNNAATGAMTAAATSSAAKVTVNALVNAATPTIGTQPADQTVNVGGSASLSVTATTSDSGTLSFQWYSNTTSSNIGGTLMIGATSATFAPPTSTAGTTYYYVVVTNTNNVATGAKTASATSSASKVTVNALVDAATPSIGTQPADQTVNVGGSAALSVAATVSDSGTPSYQWYSSATNSNIGGTLMIGATSATFAPPTGTAGTTYYYVVVTNTNNAATGATTASVTSSASKVTVNAPTITTGPSQPATPSEPEQTTGANVLVNGKVENAGTATTTKQNGQTVTTITVDRKKLEDKLAAEGQGAVVTIPVNAKSDVVAGELNGQMVKSMEDKQAVLEIATTKAAYTLPAQQINIDSVSSQFGQSVALPDIKIRIEIAEPSADMVKVVENAAKQDTFTLVLAPLNFTVKATHQDKTIEVSKFDAYVERTIAIPDGVDPNKITTGVVVEPDGTVRHVPTKIVVLDGKYYAKVNSLTNSTYSVVWHPLEFADLSGHWAKDAVNDMGSRMIIDGTASGMFSPDQPITRAEFTAIVVRGLGLKLDDEGKSFSDINRSDWYNSAINAAYAYRLITGFEDSEFRPNERLTREEAAIIIAKAMKITSLKLESSVQSPDDTLLSFIDAADVSSWAQSSMAACVQAGIIMGKPGMKLAPKDDMSRAEVAAIVQRLLQKADLI